MWYCLKRRYWAKPSSVRTNARMAASVSCATRSRRPACASNSKGSSSLTSAGSRTSFSKKPALALIAGIPAFSPGGPPNNDAISINLTEDGCRGHKCATVEKFVALPPHAFGAFIPRIHRKPETFPAFERDSIAFTSLPGLDQGHDARRERRRGKDESAGHGCSGTGHIYDQCSWIDFPGAKHCG